MINQMRISRCITIAYGRNTNTVRFKTLEDAEQYLDEIEREYGVKRELPAGISRDKKGLRV